MASINSNDNIACITDLKQSETTNMLGYIAEIDDIRQREYPMLKETTYLDHAGTTLYPKSLMDMFAKDMTSNLFGNTHSASPSSHLSMGRVEDIRLRALRFFKASPDHFDLVFVANATAGIKLILDGFREVQEGFWYGYHKDSHTSLVGARELATNGHHCFASDEEVEKWLAGSIEPDFGGTKNGLGIFAYPAQSNMNGRRLPLSWTTCLKSSMDENKIYSLLDAAALVSTSPLDLSDASVVPDFTVLSFNKMFGFPDLGALIIRKAAAPVLQKRKYFGGGTVEMATCGKENWHIQKQRNLHEQLEDGTLPIHSIIALGNAMTVHERLFGSMKLVSTHTSCLAEKLYNDLSDLRHANGTEVCKIYRDYHSSYADSSTQGPIIALNIRNSRGEWISNAEFQKLASIRNIQVRSGGLCNPGGIASHLDLQPWELRRNFSSGHRCGNENDIIDDKPTGVVRVSLGAMSNLRDVVSFIELLQEFFVETVATQQEPQAALSNRSELFVENLTVYPIKSCGGWQVPLDTTWVIKEEGLAWDREWCLVHQGTRIALSQKKHPRMALLRPSLVLDQGILRVRCRGPMPPSTPEEITVPLSADPNVFQSFDNGVPPYSLVCGEDVAAQTYSSKNIADFFSNIVGTPCTLARFPPVASGMSARHSKAHVNTRSKVERPDPVREKNAPLLLANESPILAISRASVNRLNEQIKVKGGKAAHASVFRANIIIAQDPSLAPGSELPYIEDQWRSLHVGEHLQLSVLGGCRRCQMVCVDQHSAEKNEEPFVTLAKTRRKEGKVFFGVHTALLGGDKNHSAMIKVGDKIVPVIDA
ncbi:hypothetical protein ACLMJK_005933 [Lecanora helva]